MRSNEIHQIIEKIKVLEKNLDNSYEWSNAVRIGFEIGDLAKYLISEIAYLNNVHICREEEE